MDLDLVAPKAGNKRIFYYIYYYRTFHVQSMGRKNIL